MALVDFSQTFVTSQLYKYELKYLHKSLIKHTKLPTKWLDFEILKPFMLDSISHMLVLILHK